MGISNTKNNDACYGILKKQKRSNTDPVKFERAYTKEFLRSNKLEGKTAEETIPN